MIYLAHSGHWILDLAYTVPFIGLLGWLLLTARRDRRRAAAGPVAEGDGDGSDG